ncbi:MAG: CPBP family intramembrane metalloprotease [Clostridia bacterium]|nr:CPBP family intramembrane metalloprotease [Clostridia bacterium]
MTAPILAAVVYLLLLLSRIIKITEMTGENEYIGVIVLQLLIFLLPSVIYSKLKGDGYALKLRLRPIGGQHLLVSLLGALALICGSLLLNILFADGASQDEFSLYNTFTANHDGSAESFIFVTVAYAAVPAVCEEFFFRSLLSAEYEEYGVGTALIMSSLLFGMIHYDFSQLIIYIFAGAVLFAVLYAARSVLGCIIVHFLYNMYGLFGQSFANEVYSTTGSTELFLLLLFGAFLLSSALFCGEAARLYRRYARQNKPSEYIPEKGKKRRRTDKDGVGLMESLLAPPALACYLIFLLVTLLL